MKKQAELVVTKRMAIGIIALIVLTIGGIGYGIYSQYLIQQRLDSIEWTVNNVSNNALSKEDLDRSLSGIDSNVQNIWDKVEYLH